MTIKLYTIVEDPKKLEKTLVDTGAGKNLIDSYTVNMKGGGDVLNPVFTLSGADLHAANYCYIARYGRYYFCETSVNPAGVWTIKCHVDVLMSHATQLKGLTVTLDRSETIFNGYLPDSEYNAKGYRAIVARAFDKGLTNDNYILITTG